MLSAILTTIAALVVLGVLAVVIFRVRSQSSRSRTSDRMRVKSVTSVGISAETPKTSISSGSGAAFGGTSVSGEGLRNRFIAVGVLAAGAPLQCVYLVYKFSIVPRIAKKRKIISTPRLILLLHEESFTTLKGWRLFQTVKYKRF